MAKRGKLNTLLDEAARPRAVASEPEPTEPAPVTKPAKSRTKVGRKVIRPEGRAMDVLMPFSTRMPPETVTQLRVLSAQEGRPMMYLLGEALNLLFESRRLPPIAPEHPPES